MLARLRQVIESLRIEHLYIEADTYYSCPKTPDYLTCDEPQRIEDKGAVCTCGADEHNQRVDEAIALLNTLEPLLNTLKQ